MTPADRAIVAAAEERDRARRADFPDPSAHGDRRELLRIVREQAARHLGLRDLARELVDRWHNGTITRPEAEIVDAMARLLDAAPDAAAEDPADRADGEAAEQDAEAEAEFLRPIGPGR